MKKLIVLLIAASVALLGQFPVFRFTDGADSCYRRTQNGNCFDLAISPIMKPEYTFEVNFDNGSNEPQYYRLWTSDSAHPICLRVDPREFIADEPVIVPCDMEMR